MYEILAWIGLTLVALAWLVGLVQIWFPKLLPNDVGERIVVSGVFTAMALVFTVGLCWFGELW